MKKITIEIPEGYDLEKTNDGYQLVKVDEEKKWEDFGEVKGAYINDQSKIIDWYNESSDNNRNTFPTREEANAYGLALPQLLQWRNKVNGDWKADWSPDSRSNKFCIYQNGYGLTIHPCYSLYQPLHFQTREIAEQFLKDHRTLLNELIIK